MLSSYVPRAAYSGGEEIAVPVRDLSTRGVGAQKQAPAALLLKKGPCTHCTGDWMGLEAGLDECGNCCPLQGFEPRTAQLVASRCINYTIPAVIYVLSNLCFNARKYFSALRVVWLD
jgi:hypothetical protein